MEIWFLKKFTESFGRTLITDQKSLLLRKYLDFPKKKSGKYPFKISYNKPQLGGIKDLKDLKTEILPTTLSLLYFKKKYFFFYNRKKSLQLLYIIWNYVLRAALSTKKNFQHWPSYVFATCARLDCCWFFSVNSSISILKKCVE